MNEGSSKVTMEEEGATLRDAVEELFKHRTGLQSAIGNDYVVEKRTDPGVPLNLDTRLDSLYTTEFRLRAETPPPVQQRVSKLTPKLPELKMFSAGSFQTYMVQMIQKIGKNVTVQLGQYGTRTISQSYESSSKLELITIRASSNLGLLQIFGKLFGRPKSLFADRFLLQRFPVRKSKSRHYLKNP